MSLPRYDHALEARLVGAVLSGWADTRVLDDRLFHLEKHRLVIAAARRAAANGGVTLSTVVTHLDSTNGSLANDLEVCGGPAGVAELMKDAIELVNVSGVIEMLVVLAERRAATDEDDELATDSGPMTLTDAGNARRFVNQHGRHLRHVTMWNRWLVWDGRRWTADTTGEVLRRAKATAASIYKEAAEALTEPERTRLAKHAMSSESEHAIRSMAALAAPDLAVRPQQLDADSWLFNVENGTIDLRTGQLRPHRREDLITKLAEVTYRPTAAFPLWDEFLRRAVPGTEERAFLQRAVGSTLTGDTRDERLFFVHGPEASSKSSLIEAIKGMLGNYAVTADFETFIKKRDAGVRNDIARLAGARMVVSLEVDEGRSLAEGLVKTITGGDVVAARFLYCETFEFRPTFKLWLVANVKPRARAEDGALWRRILLIPFEHTIAEGARNPGVKRELVNNPDARSAILAWAVAGCLAWQREGLGVPEAVRAATANYRNECDHIQDFLRESCRIEPTLRVATKALRAVYISWCSEAGEIHLKDKAFAAALQRLVPTAKRAKSGSVRFWTGLGISEQGTNETDGTDGAESPSRARE